MALLPRRRFLLHLAGLAPLPFLARRLHARAVADLDPRQLRALAAAVLPGELGAPGIERTTAAFERWLAGYREGVELVHGYGTGELRRTGPSPALRWTTQLRALTAAAHQAHRRSFEQLSIVERQALVRAALEGQRLGSLPAVDRAAHLSLGLLAFFYGSPEASDLCYQARIGANSCRPLAQSERRPLPLAGRS
ncbi:MAG TPA: hypothetical protein VL241_08585 [Gemmatimonadales bacterium]|jgi:hypothetical protein|nr:hypothetical protein [Gemmatimonadales bacterium]